MSLNVFIAFSRGEGLPEYAIRRFKEVCRTMRSDIPPKLPMASWMAMLEVQACLELISPAWADIERNRYKPETVSFRRSEK